MIFLASCAHFYTILLYQKQAVLSMGKAGGRSKAEGFTALRTPSVTASPCHLPRGGRRRWPFRCEKSSDRAVERKKTKPTIRQKTKAAKVTLDCLRLCGLHCPHKGDDIKFRILLIRSELPEFRFRQLRGALRSVPDSWCRRRTKRPWTSLLPCRCQRGLQLQRRSYRLPSL